MNTRERDDPLAGLRARVDDAIADLGRLGSRDPAARAAVQAIKLTRRTLQDFWAPAVAEQGSTTAK